MKKNKKNKKQKSYVRIPTLWGFLIKEVNEKGEVI